MFAPVRRFPVPSRCFPKRNKNLILDPIVMFVVEVQPMMVEPLPASRWRFC
jgi:hypothetical protein